MPNADRLHSHLKNLKGLEIGVKCRGENLFLNTNRYYENKSSSDVMDILGFFAYECVRSLTEMVLF